MRAHTDVLSGWALSGALFSLLLLFLKNNNNNNKKTPKNQNKKKTPTVLPKSTPLCAPFPSTLPRDCRRAIIWLSHLETQLPFKASKQPDSTFPGSSREPSPTGRGWKGRPPSLQPS